MILAFILFFTSIYADNKTDDYHFEKFIRSKDIRTYCDFSNKEENGLLSIKIIYRNRINSFYIWKGIDHETCIDLAFQIKKLKSNNKFLKLVGSDPSDSIVENEIAWDWKYLKSKNGCTSYLTNYCLPENHPHMMR